MLKSGIFGKIQESYETIGVTALVLKKSVIMYDMIKEGRISLITAKMRTNGFSFMHFFT